MKAQLVTSTEDVKTVFQFLKDNALPYKDIALEKTDIFTYHDNDGNLIGTGGLEFYGRYALLRSVSVRTDLRGKSIGKHIVDDLLAKARQKAEEVYLLTETAHQYFKHLKFNDVDRKSVPKEIQASTEFSNVCPTSAACMVYKFQSA
jgi:amino-acid N-acetyltransferase